VDRLLVLVVVAAAAAALAYLVQRRRPDAPIRTGWMVPEQLDRRDFARPDAPWLVAVFTSASCDSCAAVVDVAGPLASGAVAVDVVEVGERHEVLW